VSNSLATLAALKRRENEQVSILHPGDTALSIKGHTPGMLAMNRAPSSQQQSYLAMKRTAFLMGSILLVLISPLVFAAQKQIVNGGPNDYYDPDPWIQNYVRLVNEHHLLPAEEQVKKGYTTSTTASSAHRVIWEEIDFTLRWFPNHPDGLRFMAKWWSRFPHPPHKTEEYYFEKAVSYKPEAKWRPVDAVARQLYAIYLHKAGKYKEAEKLYLSAQELNPNDIELHYNMGLLYCAMKQYDKALKHAQIAYNRGFPLPGLRNKLVKAGFWKDAAKP
jgi:tetratricopeptide (TPR) repeat protein